MRGSFCWSQVYWPMFLLSVSQAVPVDRSTNYTTSVEDEALFTPTSNYSTTYGCLYEGNEYKEGQVRPSVDPCEVCSCHPPAFTCFTRTCDVKPGCKALHSAGRCCPQYDCDCSKNGRTYGNGEKIEEPNPCNVCYCRGGEIICTGVSCYTRTDCEPHYVAGKCCPKYDHCPAIEPRPATIDTEPLLNRTTTPTAEPAKDVNSQATTVQPQPNSTSSTESVPRSSTAASEFNALLNLEIVETTTVANNVDNSKVGTLEIIEIYPAKRLEPDFEQQSDLMNKTNSLEKATNFSENSHGQEIGPLSLTIFNDSVKFSEMPTFSDVSHGEPIGVMKHLELEQFSPNSTQVTELKVSEHSEISTTVTTENLNTNSTDENEDTMEDLTDNYTTLSIGETPNYSTEKYSESQINTSTGDHGGTDASSEFDETYKYLSYTDDHDSNSDVGTQLTEVHRNTEKSLEETYNYPKESYAENHESTEKCPEAETQIYTITTEKYVNTNTYVNATTEKYVNTEISSEFDETYKYPTTSYTDDHDSTEKNSDVGTQLIEEHRNTEKSLEETYKYPKESYAENHESTEKFPEAGTQIYAKTAEKYGNTEISSESAETDKYSTEIYTENQYSTGNSVATESYREYSTSTIEYSIPSAGENTTNVFTDDSAEKYSDSSKSMINLFSVGETTEPADKSDQLSTEEPVRSTKETFHAVGQITELPHTEINNYSTENYSTEPMKHTIQPKLPIQVLYKVDIGGSEPELEIKESFIQLSPSNVKESRYSGSSIEPAFEISNFAESDRLLIEGHTTEDTFPSEESTAQPNIQTEKFQKGTQLIENTSNTENIFDVLLEAIIAESSENVSSAQETATEKTMIPYSEFPTVGLTETYLTTINESGFPTSSINDAVTENYFRSYSESTTASQNFATENDNLQYSEVSENTTETNSAIPTEIVSEVPTPTLTTEYYAVYYSETSTEDTTDNFSESQSTQIVSELSAESKRKITTENYIVSHSDTTEANNSKILTDVLANSFGDSSNVSNFEPNYDINGNLTAEFVKVTPENYVHNSDSTPADTTVFVDTVNDSSSETGIKDGYEKNIPSDSFNALVDEKLDNSSTRSTNISDDPRGIGGYLTLPHEVTETVENATTENPIYYNNTNMFSSSSGTKNVTIEKTADLNESWIENNADQYEKHFQQFEESPTNFSSLNEDSTFNIKEDNNSNNWEIAGTESFVENFTEGYDIVEEMSNTTISEGPREYTSAEQGKHPKGETPEKIMFEEHTEQYQEKSEFIMDESPKIDVPGSSSSQNRKQESETYMKPRATEDKMTEPTETYREILGIINGQDEENKTDLLENYQHSNVSLNTIEILNQQENVTYLEPTRSAANTTINRSTEVHHEIMYNQEENNTLLDNPQNINTTLSNKLDQNDTNLESKAAVDNISNENSQGNKSQANISKEKSDTVLENDTETQRKPENTAATLAEILLKWLESKKAKVSAKKALTESGRKLEDKPTISNTTGAEKKDIEETTSEAPVRSLLSALSTELMKIAYELPENSTIFENSTSRNSNARSLEFNAEKVDQSLEVHKGDIEVLAEALHHDGVIEGVPHREEDDEEPIHLKYPFTDESLAPVLSMISDQLQFLKVGEDSPIYFQQPEEEEEEDDKNNAGRSHQGVVITPKSTPITVDMVKVVNEKMRRRASIIGRS